MAYGKAFAFPRKNDIMYIRRTSKHWVMEKESGMYRLLLVTDESNLLNVFGEFVDWEALGFAPPALLTDVQEAQKMVSAGDVDAVSYALPKDTGQAFYSFMAGYPHIRGMEAAGDEMRLRRAINGLRRQLRENEQEDIHGDVLPLLQNEFFHALLGGAKLTPEKLKIRMQMLKLRLDEASPLAMAQLRMPDDQAYIDQVWRYGRERLKVALHNFFDKELPKGYFVLDVMSLQEIKLLFCPVQPIGEEELLGMFYDHLTSAREEIKRYLDLGIQVDTVRVYENLASLASQQAARVVYRAEE